MGPDRNFQVGGRHYADADVQPWDVIDTWPIEQQVGFYRGNALKYVMRMGKKGSGAMDAAKAQHYQEKLISVLENYAPKPGEFTETDR